MSEQQEESTASLEDNVEVFEESPNDEDYEGLSTFDDDYQDVDQDTKKTIGLDESAIDKLKDQDEKESDEDDEEKKEKKEEEKSSEEVKEEGEEKPKYKSVKGKIGDESVDIAEEATVKILVDGKPEYPTVRELMDNYSGKKKWSQEIETAKNEVRTVRHEKKTLEKDKNEVLEHVKAIATLFDEAKEGKKSILSPMEYILSLTGRNIYDYNKLMVDQMAPIVRELDEMSDEGREAFWYKLENEHLKNNRAAEAKLSESSKGLKEKEDQLVKLRESQGVTKEQFILAQEELMEIDSSVDWTPEKVVSYLEYKPLYQTTSEVMVDFKKFIPTDKFESVQDDLVKYMRENKGTTPDEIRQILIEALDLDPIAKKLEEKLPDESTIKKAASVNKKARKVEEIETFDDF